MKNHDPEFGKNLRKLAIPIILQSLLSRAIGTADTFMLNAVGQAELSAVSLANQITTILTTLFLGLIIGTSVMLAQYLSSAHKDKASNVFSMSCTVSAVICIIFFALAVFIPQSVMRLLTNDEELVIKGASYLRIVGFSYLMMIFTQPYLVLLKAEQQATKSMILSTTALVVNLILNAVFIFGLLGAPKLGLVGVAIATLISRIVELALCAVDLIRYKYVKLVFRSEKKLWKDFFRISLPGTIQGFMFSASTSVMASIIGHISSDMVAANSIALSVQSVARVASIGMADAGAILLGGDLGRHDFEKAKAHGRQLTRITITAGIVGCILMLLSAYPVIHLMNITDTAKHYLTFMYIMQSINVIFAAITYEMLCGVFTAGGDTRFGLILDSVVMWTMVLFGYIAFSLGAAPLVVFFWMKLDELIKTPIVLARYKKNIWVRDITREE